MPSALRLERTEEWFYDICVLATGAANPIRCEADRELQSELKEKQEGVSRRIRVLRRGAREIDWNSEAQRENYIDELAQYEKELTDLLESVSEDEPMPSEEADRLQDIASELHDRAFGILEDI